MDRGLSCESAIQDGRREKPHRVPAEGAGDLAHDHDVVHPVARSEHAVVRNRTLMAAALGYPLLDAPDYGIRDIAAKARSAREVVFLHATSRADKHWPEEAWIALGQWLGERGLGVVLPWGDAGERERSERLALVLPNARVPGALPIGEVARLLAEAEQKQRLLDAVLEYIPEGITIPNVALAAGVTPAEVASVAFTDNLTWPDLEWLAGFGLPVIVKGIHHERR